MLDDQRCAQLEADRPNLAKPPQPDAGATFLTCDCCERLITYVYFKNVPQDALSPIMMEGTVDVCYPCRQRFEASGSLVFKQETEGTNNITLTSSDTILYYMGAAPMIPTRCLSGRGSGSINVHPDEQNPPTLTQVWDMTELSPFAVTVAGKEAEEDDIPKPAVAKDAEIKKETRGRKKLANNQEEQSAASATAEDATPSTRSKRDRPTSANPGGANEEPKKKIDRPEKENAKKEESPVAAIEKKARGRPRKNVEEDTKASPGCPVKKEDTTEKKAAVDAKKEESPVAAVEKKARGRPRKNVEEATKASPDCPVKKEDTTEKKAAVDAKKEESKKTVARSKKGAKNESDDEDGKGDAKKTADIKKEKREAKKAEKEVKEEKGGKREKDAAPAKKRGKEVGVGPIKKAIGPDQSIATVAKTGLDTLPTVSKFLALLGRGTRKGTRQVPTHKKSHPFSLLGDPDANGAVIPKEVPFGGVVTLAPLEQVGLNAHIAKAPLLEEGDLLGCHAIPAHHDLWWSTIHVSRVDKFILTDIWGPTSATNPTPVWRFSISCGRERIVACDWFPHVPVEALGAGRKNYLGAITFLRPSTIHMAVVCKDPLRGPAVDLDVTGLPAATEPQVFSTDVCCVFDLKELNKSAPGANPIRLKWILGSEGCGAEEDMVQAAIIYSNGVIFILGSKFLPTGKVELFLKHKLGSQKLFGGNSELATDRVGTLCTNGVLNGKSTFIVAREKKVVFLDVPSIEVLATYELEAEVTALSLQDDYLLQGVIDGTVIQSRAPWCDQPTGKGTTTLRLPQMNGEGDYVVDIFCPPNSTTSAGEINSKGPAAVMVMNSHRLLLAEKVEAGGSTFNVQRAISLVYQEKEHKGGAVVGVESFSNFLSEEKKEEEEGSADSKKSDSKSMHRKHLFEFTRFINSSNGGNALLMTDVVGGIVVAVALK